jgi:hypothetical protein
MNELINSVLDWWGENKHDCCFDGEEEWNIYDKEPEFVTLAKRLKEKEEDKMLSCPAGPGFTGMAGY